MYLFPSTPLATDDYEDEMSTVLIFPTTTVDTSVENVPETSALSISTTVNTESVCIYVLILNPLQVVL